MQLTGNVPHVEPVMEPLLSSVWNANLPIMRDRLERLDEFAAAAATRPVTHQQRSDALNIAHKLAGSLGIFGFADAGTLAKSLELQLTGSGPLDTADIQRLSSALRVALDL